MLCLTSELAEVQLRIYVIFLLCVDLIHEAFVQFLADGLFLQMLTDEYDLDHSVAHLVVPFLSELFLTCQQLVELVFRHGGYPLSSLLHGLLSSSLFEHVAHVSLVGKVADSLGSYHVAWPFACHEVVEESQVERLAAVVHEGADAVFLSLSLIVVVMMMVMVVVVMMMLVMMMLVLIVVQPMWPRFPSQTYVC